ncbi:hypothetical protein KIPB_002869, partial [Kipferlia bialata]
VTLTPMGDGVMPLFSHVLAICVDYDCTDTGHSDYHGHSDNISDNEVFQGIVSGIGGFAAIQHHMDVSRLSMDKPQGGVMMVEQDDHFCVDSGIGKVYNMSLFMETHMSGSLSDVKPVAFVMDASLLLDEEVTYELTKAIPFTEIDVDPDTLRGLFAKLVITIAEECSITPLTLIATVKKFGMLATRKHPDMYYLTPTALLVGAMKSMPRTIHSSEFQAIMATMTEVLEMIGGQRLMPGKEDFTKCAVTPTDVSDWSDILSALLSGPGCPPPKTFFFVSDCFSPLLHSTYNLPDMLKQMGQLHPAVTPAVLQCAVEAECWHAVNNTVAESESEMGTEAGGLQPALAQLRVPTITLCLQGQDTQEWVMAAQCFFRSLQYTVSLQHIAASGYKKKAKKIRLNAMKTLAEVQSTDGMSSRQQSLGDPNQWDTQSSHSYNSKWESGSQANTLYTATTSVVGSSASFFGDSYERFLPRLLLDFNVLLNGIGVSESHESPLQHVIWTIANIADFEEKAKAFVRLAIVIAAGLPPSLALPLEDEGPESGTSIQSCVTPYKVFPGGEVKCQVPTKYQPEKTLFSRVMLHIPDTIVSLSPALRMSVIAFQSGCIPPVFSQAAMGQLLLVLGEKYALPQPSPRVLSIKLSQHLGVCISALHIADPHLAANMVGVCPLPLGLLTQTVPTMTQFLTTRYDGGGLMPPKYQKEAAIAGTQLFDLFMGIDIECSPLADQFMSFSMNASGRLWQRSITERPKLTSALKGITGHEADLEKKGSLTPELKQLFGSAKASMVRMMPEDTTSSATASSLVQRGGSFASLCFFIRVLVTHQEVPAFKKVRPFLWLYLDILPPSDSALYACMQTCFTYTLYPQSVIVLSHTTGERVAQTVEMWRHGLLEKLSLANSTERNSTIIRAARAGMQTVTVHLDRGTEVFIKDLVSALESNGAIVFDTSGHLNEEAHKIMTLILGQFQTKATRAGQVLKIGQFQIRLKVPIHKRRMYLCLPDNLASGEEYRAEMMSSYLCNFTAFMPTDKIQLLKVLENATPPGDVGPLHQAARLEHAMHGSRLQYWKCIERLNTMFVKGKPPADITKYIQDSRFLDLYKQQFGSFKALCGMWTSGDISKSLTRVEERVANTLSCYTSPMIRSYVHDTATQMQYLQDGLTHVLQDGDNLDEGAILKAFGHGMGRMVTTAVGDSFNLSQLFAFVTNYVGMMQMAEGNLDDQSEIAVRFVLGHKWRSLKKMANKEKVYQLNLVCSTQLARLMKNEGAKQSLQRLIHFEASCSYLDGLCESLVSSDSAMADTIQCIVSEDGALEVLNGIVGNHRLRDTVFGDKKVSAKLHLSQDILGSTLDDATVLRHMVVVAVLNPTSALTSLGAWLRATTAYSGGMAQGNNSVHGVPQGPSLCSAGSGRSLIHSGDLVVADQLDTLGICPCYGLFPHMPSSKRVCVIPFSHIQHLPHDSPLFQQVGRMIVLVPESTDPSHNTLIDSWMHFSVSRYMTDE